MTKLIRMKKRKDNRGFSLVEVMLAICILGLVAAPLLQIIYSSYAMNIKSRKYLAAADLLQTVMEGISAQTWEDSTPIADGAEAVDGLETYYLTTLTSDDTEHKSAIFNAHGIGGSVDIPSGYFHRGDPAPVNGRLLQPLNFNKVVFNGYTFDVHIDVDVTNLTADKGKNYYTVPLKVKIFDEDGNEIASASTSVISERTKH